MSHTPFADTRSPWYEVFTEVAETRVTAEPKADLAPNQPQSADENWATEAVFGLYND